jgi:hypothetical protein
MTPDTPQPAWLTKRRWQCLQAFRRQPRLMETAFLAKQLRIEFRDTGTYRPASGALMDSLRDAGWVQRVHIADGWGAGSPFRMGALPTMWQLTDAGRKAVAECPDIFPGEPVYGKGTP